MYKTNNKVNYTLCNKNIIKKAKESLDIPICVIGGINLHNIREQVILKPDMIALIDGIFNQINSIESINLLLNEFKNCGKRKDYYFSESRRIDAQIMELNILK